MAQGPREILFFSLVGFFVFSFCKKNKKRKKEKSDLFSHQSLAFDKKRERDIRDIHTEKFISRNERAASGECR